MPTSNNKKFPPAFKFKMTLNELDKGYEEKIVEPDLKKHGAKNDFTKLSPNRRAQLQVGRNLINHLKTAPFLPSDNFEFFKVADQKVFAKEGEIEQIQQKKPSVIHNDQPQQKVLSELLARVEPNERYSLAEELDKCKRQIFSAYLWLIAYIIDNEEYFYSKKIQSVPLVGWAASKLYGPTRSVFYKNVEGVTGVSKESPLDERTLLKSLTLLRRYLLANASAIFKNVDSSILSAEIIAQKIPTLIDQLKVVDIELPHLADADPKKYYPEIDEVRATNIEFTHKLKKVIPTEKKAPFYRLNSKDPEFVFRRDEAKKAEIWEERKNVLFKRHPEINSLITKEFADNRIEAKRRSSIPQTLKSLFYGDILKEIAASIASDRKSHADLKVDTQSIFDIHSHRHLRAHAEIPTVSAEKLMIGNAKVKLQSHANQQLNDVSDDGYLELHTKQKAQTKAIADQQRNILERMQALTQKSDAVQKNEEDDPLKKSMARSLSRLEANYVARQKGLLQDAPTTSQVTDALNKNMAKSNKPFIARLNFSELCQTAKKRTTGAESFEGVFKTVLANKRETLLAPALTKAAHNVTIGMSAHELDQLRKVEDAKRREERIQEMEKRAIELNISAKQQASKTLTKPLPPKVSASKTFAAAEIAKAAASKPLTADEVDELKKKAAQREKLDKEMDIPLFKEPAVPLSKNPADKRPAVEHLMAKASKHRSSFLKEFNQFLISPSPFTAIAEAQVVPQVEVNKQKSFDRHNDLHRNDPIGKAEHQEDGFKRIYAVPEKYMVAEDHLKLFKLKHVPDEKNGIKRSDDQRKDYLNKVIKRLYLLDHPESKGEQDTRRKAELNSGAVVDSPSTRRIR